MFLLLSAISCHIAAGFLLPPEVVSCSYLPEPGLRAHCVRVLREQWESEARHLASIPEEPSADGMLMNVMCMFVVETLHIPKSKI